MIGDGQTAGMKTPSLAEGVFLWIIFLSLHRGTGFVAIERIK